MACHFCPTPSLWPSCSLSTPSRAEVGSAPTCVAGHSAATRIFQVSDVPPVAPRRAFKALHPCHVACLQAWMPRGIGLASVPHRVLPSSCLTGLACLSMPTTFLLGRWRQSCCSCADVTWLPCRGTTHAWPWVKTLWLPPRSCYSCSGLPSITPHQLSLPCSD